MNLPRCKCEWYCNFLIQLNVFNFFPKWRIWRCLICGTRWLELRWAKKRDGRGFPNDRLPPFLSHARVSIHVCFREGILVYVHTLCTGMMSHIVHGIYTGAVYSQTLVELYGRYWWKKPGYVSEKRGLLSTFDVAIIAIPHADTRVLNQGRNGEKPVPCQLPVS